ncbi:MAG TPA: PAS domain-containing protein [Anaerolineales bacterium]|nr:PAS domain-containing protein [Anaerolineales bacterium]
MEKIKLELASVGLSRELREGMIRSIIVGVMVASLIFLAGAFFAYREIINRALIVGLFTCLIGGINLLLVGRGHVKAASILLIIFLWLIVSVGIYTAGGLHAPIWSGYFVVILLGWLFIDFWGGVFALAVSLIFSFYIYFAEVNGFLPEKITYTPAAQFAIGSFFLIVISLVQRSAAVITMGAVKQAQKSDEDYRSFLENIPVVTYINDLSSEALTLYVSPQVEKMLGYSQAEMLTNPLLWFEIVHPDDRDLVNYENRITVEAGRPFELSYRLLTKKGEVIWVRDEAKLVKNDKGEPMYWLGVWTEITQHKLAEYAREETVELLMIRTTQLLTASEVSTAAASILELNDLLPKVVELIRSHFNYYFVSIFLVDERNEKAVLRAATGEIGNTMLAGGHSLVIGNSSMIGWCIANNQARIALDVGKDAVRFINPLLPLTRSEIALPLRTRDGVIGAMGFQSERPSAFTEWDIQALQTMANQVANAINTARLFEERSHLIKEMETKNAELEKFTYTVSHDLKSPLVTIRGYLGYLRSDAQKGDMERFDKDMARVIKSTEIMQALLQDLLDLSRVGRIINLTEKVQFRELVEETVNLIMAPGVRSRIRVEIQPHMPDILADRTRIIEVLQNLISNSIKFMGRQETPVISIGSSGRDTETGFPIFFVKDNGIGVEPQHHEHIFGLFNRLNPEVKGTGIGLALVKRIIEVHGGRIWLESEGNNKGSTFYFTLPSA